MPSSFTWLDNLPEDAKRVREALRALEEPGTVDPLGIGPVRDAFSDILFPGLSTVMTRARYFVFVPWIFQEVDRHSRSPKAAAEYGRELEVRLIHSLLDGSDDWSGIIGQNSRNNTKQLPSVVYWGGLGQLGIRTLPGSRADYFASVGSTRAALPWNASLKHLLPPDGWLDATTLEMTRNEADFLRDRILNTAANSFLGVLARDVMIGDGATLPWDHPSLTNAPASVQNSMDHARLFSIGMWGAGLLYNMELERLRSIDSDSYSVDEGIQEDFAEWQRWVTDIRWEFAHWDRGAMWSLLRSMAGSVNQSFRFVEWWLEQVASAHGVDVDSTDTRRRIRDQELSVKGTRSKLAHRRAREQSKGLSGHNLLTFRWGTANNVVSDIAAASN